MKNSIKTVDNQYFAMHLQNDLQEFLFSDGELLSFLLS